MKITIFCVNRSQTLFITLVLNFPKHKRSVLSTTTAANKLANDLVFRAYRYRLGAVPYSQPMRI